MRYLIWAQSEPGIATNSNLYIARMAGPKAITGTPVRIATPTLAWETRGYKVNEGPTVIQRYGRIFLAFSAGATDANYCLGLLTASASSDLLDPTSWVKSPDPVFTSNAATSQYGPGHNSFTVSEDGQSDILVYHDRSYRDISGDPLNEPNRRTRVQKLYWNADGTPDFGIPVPDGATPVRLQSSNHPDRHVRHREFRARVEATVTTLADSQFRITTGLAGSGSVSLESTNYPGYFLRHKDFVMHVERNDDTVTFKADASFQQRAGLASGSAVSFESTNFPGRYYLAYTTGWTGNTIGLARGDNQVDWAFLRDITLPTANLTRTWAPEWFTDSDGSVHLVVSLSVDGGTSFRPHELRALDTALSSWSTPVPLNGLGPNHTDTFVVKVGSTYHAFVKNETTKYVEYATATSLTGAYTFRGTGNWAGWGSTLEGPVLVKLDNGGWRLYFDAYPSGHYYFTDSHDGFASWTAKADLPGGLSGFVRHLTVLREPSGTPPALTVGAKVSLRSTNFPGMYVRHQDYAIRVDQYQATCTLKADASFTLAAPLS